jgi:hypothetical protein
MQTPTQTRWLGSLAASLVLVSAACGGSSADARPETQTPSPSPRTVLTSAEQSQLAQLESRPLNLPVLPTGGACPADGPHTGINPYRDGREESNVYGLGPVYGQGGPELRTSLNLYYDVKYFSDPSVRGVVLVRGQELGTSFKLLFVGDYAAGGVVGTDTVQGTDTNLHDELALPVATPSANTGAASGWGIFRVRQGVERNYRCVGIQIDTIAGSQVVVATRG